MSYFEENRKFLGLNGILGRRDFIVNCVIIEIIESLICSTPLAYLLLFNPSLLSGFSSSSSVPAWYNHWIAIVGLISSVLYFSSIIRRVRDILGQEDDNKINLIAGILTVLNFVSYLPLGFIGKLVGFSVLIYLAVQSGAITSQKPKSEIIKFNWGAFFGTWLWGIFNKTPLTLFMIPLFFTFAGFPFMILCGLKGNELAYYNKKYDDVQKFHNSQQNQALLWIILTPVLSVVFSMIFVFTSGAVLYKYANKHPEVKAKMINSFKTYQASAVEASFDKIEIKDGEYKFYTDPEDWKELSQTWKYSQYKNALMYALTKEGKSIAGNEGFAEFVEVFNNVKLYSTFNNEILAQYYMEPKEAKSLLEQYKEKKITARELQNAIRQGYKFNNTPTLP